MLVYTKVFAGTIPVGASLLVLGLRLALIFIVVRIFSFERTRRGYISLKGVFDRVFGAALAALGAKVAIT